MSEVDGDQSDLAIDLSECPVEVITERRKCMLGALRLVGERSE
jgi:hypothetical protein